MIESPLTTIDRFFKLPDQYPPISPLEKPKMPGQRAQTRTLMRWNVDHDQRLLLCIQYVCTEKQIKLPWDEIAKHLDDKCSGGAIVQHLSKLRAGIVQKGQPVPPPLRRSAASSQQSGAVTVMGMPSPVSPEKDPKTRPQPGDIDPKTESDFEGSVASSYTPSRDRKVPKRGTRPGAKMGRAKQGRAAGKNKNKATMRGTENTKTGKDDGTSEDFVPGAGKRIKSDNTGLGPEQGTSVQRHPANKGLVESGGKGLSNMDFIGQSAEKFVFTGDNKDVEKPKLVAVLRVQPSFSSKKFPSGLAQWPEGVTGLAGDYMSDFSAELTEDEEENRAEDPDDDEESEGDEADQDAPEANGNEQHLTTDFSGQVHINKIRELVAMADNFSAVVDLPTAGMHFGGDPQPAFANAQIQAPMTQVSHTNVLAPVPQDSTEAAFQRFLGTTDFETFENAIIDWTGGAGDEATDAGLNQVQSIDPASIGSVPADDGALISEAEWAEANRIYTLEEIDELMTDY